ncbi:MAG TPA: hypothetical protein VIV57_07255 [Anaeromyxobacter sp.]
MGKLYDAKVKLEQVIREKKLDEAEVKGSLSLKSGVLLALVRPDTPDDPAKLEKLRAAARQVLHAEI